MRQWALLGAAIIVSGLAGYFLSNVIDQPQPQPQEFADDAEFGEPTAIAPQPGSITPAPDSGLDPQDLAEADAGEFAEPGSAESVFPESLTGALDQPLAQSPRPTVEPEPAAPKRTAPRRRTVRRAKAPAPAAPEPVNPDAPRFLEAPDLDSPQLEVHASVRETDDGPRIETETRTKVLARNLADGDLGVTQGEWAWNLVKSLNLEQGVPPDATDQDAIDLLNGRPKQTVSLLPGANGFQQSADQECGEQGMKKGAQALAKGLPNGPNQAFDIDILQSGFYQLRVLTSGGASRWNLNGGPAQVLKSGEEPVRAESEKLVLLARGKHVLNGEIPEGVEILCAELVPVDKPSIRPEDGWKPDQDLTFGDKALTMIQAMGLENDLPPAELPQVIEAESLTAEGIDAIFEQTASGGGVARLQSAATLRFNPKTQGDGLYTLFVRGAGVQGSAWAVNDGVRRPIPSTVEAKELGWWELGSFRMGPGQQTVRGDLPEGARVDALRIVKRAESGSASLSMLHGLGFEEGLADERVSPGAAQENLQTPAFLATRAAKIAAYTAGGLVAAASFIALDPLELRESNDSDDPAPPAATPDPVAPDPDPTPTVP